MQKCKYGDAGDKRFLHDSDRIGFKWLSLCIHSFISSTSSLLTLHIMQHMQNNAHTYHSGTYTRQPKVVYKQTV